MKRLRLQKRIKPLTEQEWRDQLKYWSDIAEKGRQDARERSIVDWNKLNYILC